MNGFVDECRREWKRLGVPRSVAEDMAAELEADLNEGTVEDVLGSDAADARSFAQSWALERGVVRSRRRAHLPAVVATLALIPTILGAALTIDAARSESFALSRAQIPPPSVWIAPAPPPRSHLLIAQAAHDRAAALSGERVRVVAADDDSNALGIVLLIVGLALLVPVTLYWSGRVAFHR